MITQIWPCGHWQCIDILRNYCLFTIDLRYCLMLFGRILSREHMSTTTAACITDKPFINLLQANLQQSSLLIAFLHSRRRQKASTLRSFMGNLLLLGNTFYQYVVSSIQVVLVQRYYLLAIVLLLLQNKAALFSMKLRLLEVLGAVANKIDLFIIWALLHCLYIGS